MFFSLWGYPTLPWKWITIQRIYFWWLWFV